MDSTILIVKKTVRSPWKYVADYVLDGRKCLKRDCLDFLPTILDHKAIDEYLSIVGFGVPHLEQWWILVCYHEPDLK